MSGSHLPRLFYHPSSPCALRVQLALHFKGHPFVRTLVKPDQLQLPGFLEINPMGKLPVLMVHDKVFTQSTTMIQYLEDIVEDPPLWPWEPYQKQEVNEIVNIITNDLQPICNMADVHGLENQGFALSWIHRGLAALEERLFRSSGNPHTVVPRVRDSPVQNYCFRNQITAADIFFIPQIRWCIERNIDLAAYPVIRTIYKNLIIHPTMRKAVIENRNEDLFLGSRNEGPRFNDYWIAQNVLTAEVDKIPCTLPMPGPHDGYGSPMTGGDILPVIPGGRPDETGKLPGAPDYEKLQATEATNKKLADS